MIQNAWVIFSWPEIQNLRDPSLDCPENKLNCLHVSILLMDLYLSRQSQWNNQNVLRRHLIRIAFRIVAMNSVFQLFMEALLFLLWLYLLYNQTILMLQSLWRLMAQPVRRCLGLRGASGRHVSLLLLYWLVFLSGQNIIFLSQFIQNDSSSNPLHTEGYSLLFVDLPV